MLRALKLIVLAVVAALLIMFCVINAQTVEVELLPAAVVGLIHAIFPSTVEYDFNATVWLWVVILVAVLAGLLLGFILEWVREHKHRKTARVKRREAQELHQENRQLKRQLDDDDLPKIPAR